MKFMVINSRGLTNVKYFLCKHSFLQFCKDTAKVTPLPLLKITTKSTHFLTAKKEIPTLWNVLETNKCKRSQNLTSKYQAIKNMQIAKIFSKNVNKEVEQFFKKWVVFFFTVFFCLFTCTNQCTKNEHFRE